MQFLDLFENWADTQSFEPGAALFSEDDPADFLYVVLSGDVELTFRGESLGIEQRGGIVGQMAVIAAARRNATATAVTPVSAARLSLDQFRELIDRDSAFAFHAMATLANRLRAVDGFISRQLDSKGA